MTKAITQKNDQTIRIQHDIQTKYANFVLLLLDNCIILSMLLQNFKNTFLITTT
jgi:hypothetical protein